MIEIFAYFVGKSFAKIFIPSVGIENFEKQRNPPNWKWHGFTYEKKDKKYFYTEGLQIIGLLVIAFMVAFIYGTLHYAN